MTTRTIARPLDLREFVRISVDIYDHPKIVALDDPAAAWAYVVAVAYAGKNTTDGIVPLKVVARLAGVSMQKARKLVTVGLLHEHGHTCEKCPEIPKLQACVHDYLQHQRSKADADEQRRSAAERGRKGAAKRWQVNPSKTRPETDSNSHSPSHGTSNGKYMAEVEEEERPTHLPDAPYVPTTRENDHEPNRPATGPAPSGPRSVQAYRLVSNTIGHRIPSATRSALAFEVVQLLSEFDEPTIGAALQLWNQKTGIGPKILPSLVADIVKEQAGAGATLVAGGRASRPPSGREAKVRGWLELGAGDGSVMPAQRPFGGSLVDAPFLTIESGGES